MISDDNNEIGKKTGDVEKHSEDDMRVPPANNAEEELEAIKSHQGLAVSSRIVPLAFLIGTFSGFIALAWYAYHAGSQAVTEDELLIIEADGRPVKEKPKDPGGMQFPNQDKTIFDTFSSSEHQPAKGEHVMPMPEEPIAKEMDMSDTQTWINDKLHNKTAASEKPVQTEQLIGKKQPVSVAVDGEPKIKVLPSDNRSDVRLRREYESEKASLRRRLRAAVKHAEIAKVEAKKQEELVAKAKANNVDTVTLDAMQKTARRAAAVAQSRTIATTQLQKIYEEFLQKPAPDMLPVEAPKVAEKTAKDTPAAKPYMVLKSTDTKPVIQRVVPVKSAPDPDIKKLSGGTSPSPRVASLSAQAITAKPGKTYKVQLGAFKSERDAMAGWTKMQKTYSDLKTMKPHIVRADLGSKGVYHRLRAGEFRSRESAKAFCGVLAKQGQGCLVPVQ